MCSCAPFPKVPGCGDIHWDRNQGMLPNYPPFLIPSWAANSLPKKIPPGMDKRLELGLIPGEREFLMGLFLEFPGSPSGLEVALPSTPNPQGMWRFPEGDSSSPWMGWENPEAANPQSMGAANSQSMGASSTIPSTSHPKRIPKIPLDWDPFSVLEQLPGFSSNPKKSPEKSLEASLETSQGRRFTIPVLFRTFIYPTSVPGWNFFPIKASAWDNKSEEVF